MDQPSSDALDRRLSRVERSARRDRLIGMAVLALLFASAQAPAPPSAGGPVTVRDASGASATLTATGLVVRDAAGKARAFAGIDSEGRPSFDLSDQKGTLRQTMFLLDDAPQLRQFDTAGNERDSLFLGKTGEAEFDIRDEHEKIRMAAFRGAQSGNPEVALYGSDEKPRAYLATDDASPYLVMKDAAGGTRVYMGGYTDGSIGIDVRNASNTTLWSAP